MVLGSVRMMISLKPMEWGDYLVFIKKKKKKRGYSDYITRSGWYLAEGTEYYSMSLVCSDNVLMSSVTPYVENSNATTVAQV